MASNDSDCSTISSSKAVEIQPSLPQIYPRLHLLSLPQELQDLIFDYVFHRHALLLGFKKLRPILICRHIYHISHVKAWGGAGFTLIGIADKDIEAFKSRIPMSVESRKVTGLMANASDIPTLVDLQASLPRCEFLSIVGRGKKLSQENEEDAEKITYWHTCLLKAIALFQCADRVMFPAEVFEKNIASGIEHQSALVRVARAAGVGHVELLAKRLEDVPEFRVVYVPKSASAEHYKIIIGALDANPRAYRIMLGTPKF